MINTKRSKTLIALLIIGIVISVAAIGSSSTVNANDNDTYPSIVSRLAEKFNLDEQEVEAVFDSVMDERRQDMRDRFHLDLGNAVADGVITQDQKDVIIAKHEEIIQDRLDHHEEMTSWYSDQGIDFQTLYKYLGFGKMGHFGHRMH